MNSESNIPQMVKNAVTHIDPHAEVYLFGSRARGDSRKESDWDFLVLTNLPVNAETKKRFWDSVYSIELQLEESIFMLIQNKNRWNDYELHSVRCGCREIDQGQSRTLTRYARRRTVLCDVFEESSAARAYGGDGCEGKVIGTDLRIVYAPCAEIEGA